MMIKMPDGDYMNDLYFDSIFTEYVEDEFKVIIKTYNNEYKVFKFESKERSEQYVKYLVSVINKTSEYHEFV